MNPIVKKYVRNKSENRNNDRYKGKGKGRGKRPYRHWSPPPHLSPYERSVWLYNSFTGRVVKARDNESVDNLLRRFKKSVESAGVMRELKRREYYLSKSQKRREKRKRALKRLRKRMKIEQALAEQEEKRSARSHQHDRPPRTREGSNAPRRRSE